MVRTLVEMERGNKETALRSALQSARLAHGYEIPSRILASVALDAYETDPLLADEAGQVFERALKVAPDSREVCRTIK